MNHFKDIIEEESKKDYYKDLHEFVCKAYEQNTYTESLKNIDTANTDIVVLTQLYPDIKANEMVNTQIKIYQDNNNKIKNLKEEKLNYQVSKWWLYFGNIESE